MSDMQNDIIYKAALTLTHEELAGMYSLCNKREQDYIKEIKALRLILKSHGEIVEINSELKKENEKYQDIIQAKNMNESFLEADNIVSREENARLREALEKIASEEYGRPTDMMLIARRAIMRDE